MPESRVVLALDLGTRMGWAMEMNGKIVSGTMDFSNHRFEGGGMRFVRFVDWLRDIPTPNLVYFEEVRRHLGTDAAHTYGGFAAHLMAWCESQTPPIPYLGIPVGTIKKHATGKGNASKEEMVAAPAKSRGWAPADDNEADALWLLNWAIQGHRPLSLSRLETA